MDWLYKFHMFIAVCVVVVTFWDIAEMIITRAPISTFRAAGLLFCWVVMVSTNRFWRDVWKNK